jgi:quercetin dioxygenase-like cupin family protein
MTLSAALVALGCPIAIRCALRYGDSTDQRSMPPRHQSPAAASNGHLVALSVMRCAQYAAFSAPADPKQIAKECVMSVQERKLVYSDIKPENPPERAAHYVDVPNMPWEATKFPGIRIKVLYTDDAGITTALFKLEPGAVVPLHEHTALEQTYVIEGSLQDHEGKCGPGQFVWRPAGNQHEAVAPNGAVLLGFFLKPNRFAYGEKFFTAPGER